MPGKTWCKCPGIIGCSQLQKIPPCAWRLLSGSIFGADGDGFFLPLMFGSARYPLAAFLRFLFFFEISLLCICTGGVIQGEIGVRSDSRPSEHHPYIPNVIQCRPAASVSFVHSRHHCHEVFAVLRPDREESSRLNESIKCEVAEKVTGNVYVRSQNVIPR